MGVAYDRWNHYWCTVLALHRYWGIQSAGFPHRRHHFISFFLFPSEKIWFSGLLAIIAVSFMIVLFVHFLQGEKKQIGEAFNEEKALKILTTYGGNSDSQLIFLKDKRMFAYEKTVNQLFFSNSLASIINVL